jgi:molybdopterin/thiamine biosynthesis adenylyltransferase/molybdopterin synthase catalytic subunit/rhodanese-related sulfurtransferase
MFRLTDQPILAQPLEQSGAGGFVSFEGKVRNHAGGRDVVRLEYEAYPELAEKEGEVLCQEAVGQFGLLAVEVAHRTGLLEIGETAVLIQVAAPHRREAFAACEWIIDQLKHRVPIWKREHYAEGDSGWIGSDTTFAAADDGRWDRQVALAEVGRDGQDKLRAARVLLIGVGGLGSGSLPCLAGAGIGTIGLVDDDEVDLTNLHRQTIYKSEDVGRKKVDRAADFVRKLNPQSTVEMFPEHLTAQNVDRMVGSFDWIVDGTDSLEVKFLLNDACLKLGKPLVTASVHRFEGHLMTVVPGGPCLRCLFPVPPPPHCVGTCAETGILGVVPGIFGALQANEVMKGILGYGEVLSHEMLVLDLRTGETSRFARVRNNDCPICSGGLQTVAVLEADSLGQARDIIGEFTLVDVRETDELPEIEQPHIRLPMSKFDPGKLPTPAVLVCESGTRSYQLAARMHALGKDNVLSLKGGIGSLSDDRIEARDG